MSDAAERHRQQIAAWNGPLGAQWATDEARMERALRPVTEALLAAAGARLGETVLDIGCGCGGSSFAFADAVGATGRVIGADVSAPMLDVARAGAGAVANTDFVLADAAAHDFPVASVDLLTSRFGVMFFGDPDAAFGRMRPAMKPDGRVALAVWRSVAENPWVHVPLAAALTVLPDFPRPGPEDPGPFTFGDPARVTRILTAGGFTTPAFAKFDFSMRFPGEPCTAAAAIAALGQVSRALRNQPDNLRAAALDAIATAVDPYSSDGYVSLGAAIWLVTATT